MKEIQLLLTGADVFDKKLDHTDLIHTTRDSFRIGLGTMRQIILAGRSGNIDGLFVRIDCFPIVRRTCAKKQIPIIEIPYDHPTTAYDEIQRHTQNRESGRWLYLGKRQYAEPLERILQKNSFQTVTIDLDS